MQSPLYIYIVSYFFSQSAYVFVKGCNEASCGPWTACPAACNTAGTQTRDCTDPVCGVEEEQRPCTGPCKYSKYFLVRCFLFFLIRMIRDDKSAPKLTQRHLLFFQLYVNRFHIER